MLFLILNEFIFDEFLIVQSDESDFKIKRLN